MDSGQIQQTSIGDIPALVHPQTDSESLIPWLTSNQELVKQYLIEHGLLLLRDFQATASTTAEDMLTIFGNELLDDAYWSTPRSGVASKTFTATEYPADKTIALHSEMAYMRTWPRFVAFHSLIAADQGGETTLCNIDQFSREIQDLLPEFQQREVLYRRTFHPHVDIPWQKAFQTDDPKQVKKVADKIGMEVEWIRDDVLQTSHKVQGCINDETGKPLWFNQSHIYHKASLPQDIREELIDIFGEDELPRSAYYGDGSPIPDQVIQQINITLDKLTIKVPWRANDVLLIDNMRYMHGRMPFKGDRKLFVALADGYNLPARIDLFSNTPTIQSKSGLLNKLKGMFN